MVKTQTSDVDDLTHLFKLSSSVSKQRINPFTRLPFKNEVSNTSNKSLAPQPVKRGGSRRRRRTAHSKRKSHRNSKRVHHTRRKHTRRHHHHSRRRHRHHRR